MEQLFDSLSEDWVSQPRSSLSIPIRSDSPAPGNSSQQSNVSQSRIPRYSSRSVSSLGAKGVVSSRRDLSDVPNKEKKSALEQRSSSDINASHRLEHAPSKQSPAQSKPKNRRQASAGSIPPISQGTVQRNPSQLLSEKGQNPQRTPEWKRRVMKRNSGSGEQCDLFSPIGLTNVFKPPTIDLKGKPRHDAKKNSSDYFPSSPPPYPKVGSRESISVSRNPGQTKRFSPVPENTPKQLQDGLRPVAQKATNVKVDGIKKNPTKPMDNNTGSSQTKPFSPSTRAAQRQEKSKSNGRSTNKSSHHVLDGQPPSSIKEPVPEILTRLKSDRNSSIHSQDPAEMISPLYISRHHTMDGRVDFAALDLSEKQLRIQMERLKLQRDNVSSSRMSDDGIDYTESKSPIPGFDNQEWTSQSLPDDLSMGTDAFAANGGFVSIRRGGYSSDDSFQRRALSPSSLPHVNESYQRSSPFSKSVPRGANSTRQPSQHAQSKSTPAPRTPTRDDVGNSSSQEPARSSGSPLKLFDNYDTFTNDRLSRRMSKFEENISLVSDEDIKKRRKNNTHNTHTRYDMRLHQTHQRRVSSFGDGILDHHKFSPYHSPRSSSKLEQKEGSDDSNSKVQLRSNGFRFHQPNSPTLPYQSRSVEPLSRDDSSSASPNLLSVCGSPLQSISSSKRTTNRASTAVEYPKEDLQNAQGKRLPRSPAKDPQPKRRRTLRYLEESDCEHNQMNLPEQNKVSTTNSVVGRKRKDALYDSQSQEADPKVLATRTILRPRTSTIGHKSQLNQVAHAVSSVEVEAIEYQGLKTLQPGQHQLKVDPSNQVLAEELANFTLNITQDIANGSRKVSVTTADFFNEAEQIMQLIRAQARPLSSHRNLEDDAAHREILGESCMEDSTRDEFSRPPSREGASLRRLREPVQADARVISHLKKFEEKDDFGLALSSSLKSLQIKQAEYQSSKFRGDQIKEDHTDHLESDPPNLRIIESRLRQDVHNVSTVDNPISSDTKRGSVASQRSSGPSTGQSLNTGSSRGSRNKVVIAPETVSHLLSDQIAGMRYDSEKQVWVKYRSSSARDRLDEQKHASSDFTEDDLLDEIPDLSVDELEEMRRVKEATDSLKSMGSASNGILNQDFAGQEETRKERPYSDADSRPQTAENAENAPQDDSSAPSKYSRFASSGPVPETRATSWGEDIVHAKITELAATSASRPTGVSHEDHDEEVEHEISILEGRVSRTPNRLSGRECQPRVVTVAFSSPSTNQNQTPYHNNSRLDIWEDESDLPLDDSPIRIHSHSKVSSTKKHPAQFGRGSKYRNSSRRSSLGSQPYVTRPMSRLDEQDEIAFLQHADGNRTSGMSVVISTPLSAQEGMIVSNSSAGLPSSVGFHLSPLADFTVHQIDKSFHREGRDISRRCGLMPPHEIEDRFSLATQALVKQLTDIEPYEPYWDFLHVVDLQSRGLVNLYMLDEFCSRAETLNVSNNSLDQLAGAPSTIRDLKICQNRLNDLTAWGHLYNLQYLDISHNQIQSLKGFQGLIHLRELKADGNQIECLDGILELDGLISLSLRDNYIRSIELEGSNL